MRLIAVIKFYDSLEECIVNYRDSVLDFLEIWEKVLPLVYPQHNIRKFKRELGTILKLRNITNEDLDQNDKIIISLWDHLTTIKNKISKNYDAIESNGYSILALETTLTDCFILVRKFKDALG